MKQLFSEAIKLKDGIFYNLPCHQARVNETLACFGGESTDIAGALSEIPAHARRGLFKCRVVYGTAGVESVEFIPYTFRRPATVALVAADDLEYRYKSTDRGRLNELLRQSECDDIVIIKNGCITDASAANLVFESPAGLFTPDTCLLPGTKRRALLDAGVIAQGRITPADIRSFCRIRFISAMIDLEDGICIDPRAVKI